MIKVIRIGLGEMKHNIGVVIFVCLVIVAIHVVNVSFGSVLIQMGVFPREYGSLLFVFTAPWIHSSWGHLFSNIGSLAILSGLCLLRGITFYVKSSLFVMMLSGVLVWIFARDAVHLGASGWVFGLWALTISIAWFDRKISSILVAVFVLFFYGGMLYGLLPTTQHISFESHLFGAISGVLYAYLSTKYRAFSG